MQQSLLRMANLKYKDDDHFLKEWCTLVVLFCISDSLDSRSCRSAILPQFKQVWLAQNRYYSVNTAVRVMWLNRRMYMRTFCYNYYIMCIVHVFVDLVCSWIYIAAGGAAWRR